MSTDTDKRQRSSLPRYYAITALVMLMLLIAAGGLITYRLALDALEEQVSADNVAFVGTIDRLARRAALNMGTTGQLQELTETEMARRPVVKVIVYDEIWRIRFSTNPSEIGRLVLMDERSFNYERRDGELIRYASLDTGEELLRARDLVVTKVSVNRQTWYGAPGITVYTDVTDERRSIIRTDALVVGALELVLILLLVVILLRRA